MNCHSCGANIEDYYNFCRQCGARVNHNTTAHAVAIDQNYRSIKIFVISFIGFTISVFFPFYGIFPGVIIGVASDVLAKNILRIENNTFAWCASFFGKGSIILFILEVCYYIIFCKLFWVQY